MASRASTVTPQPPPHRPVVRRAATMGSGWQWPRPARGLPWPDEASRRCGGDVQEHTLGLHRRSDVELLAQRALTDLVPAHGSTALPEQRIALHQTLVGILAAGLLGQQLVRAGDTALQVAPDQAQLRQLRQDEQILILELFAAQHGPLFVQVFDEEIVTIERLRRGELAYGRVLLVLAFIP